MNINLEGNALVLGKKNIDTDQIYPGRYLAITDPKEIASHCLEGVNPDIAKTFQKGGVVVTGTNFGCGSSREHAAIALQHMGVAAVIGESFARIFYRNAINLGLPLIVCKGISEHVHNGDQIFINIQTGKILNQTTNTVLYGERMGDYAMTILEAGGIKSLFKNR